MEELVIIILRIFFIILRIIIEFGIYLPLDRTIDKRNSNFSAANLGFIFLIFGALLGWFSLLINSQLFIQTPIFRIINLIVSPITTGIVSYYMSRQNNVSKQYESMQHFWWGFWFSFGINGVRLAFNDF